MKQSGKCRGYSHLTVEPMPTSVARDLGNPWRFWDSKMSTVKG